MKAEEREVKFYIADLPAVERRLQDLGATQVQPRTLETNLRFDAPQGELGRAFKALRLRQDTQARLTYKGPAHGQDGVRVREEIEFTVGNFGMARRFLGALGYQVYMVYEKYRAAYELGVLHIVLDELPYGNFIEIEGPEAESIKNASRQLGLDWSAAVPLSYTLLFEKLRAAQGLQFRDLVFENFKEHDITPGDLDVRPADSRPADG